MFGNKPSLNRKKVKAFLLRETDYREKLIRKVAENQVRKIAEIQGNSRAITETEILIYVRDHFNELDKTANQLIDDMIAEEIIPKSDLCHYLTLFSLLSVVFVVPLGSLIYTAITELLAENCNLLIVGNALLGALLLLIFLGAAMVSEILKK